MYYLRPNCRNLSFLSKQINSKGIQILTLKNKPVNALIPLLLQELKEELLIVKQPQSNVKGLILASALPKVYSAGLDLKTLVAHDEFSLPGDGTNATAEEMKKYKHHIKSYMGLFSEVVRLLLTLPQPTISVLKGFAPAGGTVLALCCDYRIGSDAGFTMGLNEVQVGMAPPLWVHRLMLNAIGPRKSMLAVQKGQMFGLDECVKLGLVDQVVPDMNLIDSAEKEILSFLELPSKARIDAKLKGIENVSSLFNEKTLEDVVESISGPEFQVTVKGILEKLLKNKPL